MNKSPLVSVVIPTCRRTDLLLRAVETVLAQTFRDLELIIVLDGPDPMTLEALSQRQDERVTVIALPENVGGADARNIGVRAASAEWIAFLDDDDEWLPDKLEKQMPLALRSAYKYPIVATGLIGRTPKADYKWPKTLPKEPLSEYLFARNSWTYGEGLLQTSTLIATRELLLKVPFRSGLRRHQDWDWLLRATQLSGVGIEFLSEALAIWNVDESRQRVSSASNWQGSMAWIREQRSFVTRRAYAGFIATHVSFQAAAARDWKAFVPLLKEMIHEGDPKFIDLSLYLMLWFTPKKVRLWGKRLLDAYKPKVGRAATTDHLTARTL